MIPLTRWLTKDLDEYVRSCIAPERVRREGIPDRALVKVIYAGAHVGDSVLACKLWAICMFQSWMAEQ
jgi:hypothetical protein